MSPRRDRPEARSTIARVWAARLAAVAAALTLYGAVGVAGARAQEPFRIAWSGHADWAPWGYAAKSGIVARWSEATGAPIEVVYIDNHAESLKDYAAGRLDGLTASNIDALEISSFNFVDSTAVVVLDFSNGGVGLVAKGGGALADLAGRRVYLERYSEVHYLLDRCLETVGLTEADVEIVDAHNGAIVDAFQRPEVEAAGSWDPYLSEMLKQDGAQLVCDSSQTPGEIMGLMIVRTETVWETPALGTALAGIWYEALSTLRAATPEGAQARAETAALIGVSPEELEAELLRARFIEVDEAAALMSSRALRNIITYVRRFLYTHDLLGPSVEAMDDIGIELGDGDYIGRPTHVMLRFDPSYVAEIAAQ